MMIRLLYIFTILLLSVAIGTQLKTDPGYLLIVINQWTIETTLAIAIIILLLIFLLGHILLSGIAKIITIPGMFRKWRTKRRSQIAQAQTRRGLIEFSEGYWSEAREHLIKALPNTDTPLFNYLTAARAAQEMGENQLRDTYLREAQQLMPEAKIAVELTQAQLQLANQQWEQALATLRHLQDLAPHHPYVLKLLMELYQQVRDWPQLIALLPELQKKQVISESAFIKLRHHAYLQVLVDLAKHQQETALQELLASLPKSLHQDPLLMAEYCHYLVKNQQLQKAENILRNCLRKHYHDKLITLYGQIQVNEKQLIFAESLLKKQRNSAELLLCLGHLSLSNQLWGKARNYLERSLALKPSPQAYATLGQLLLHLNEQNAACLAYQRGVELAILKESE